MLSRQTTPATANEPYFMIRVVGPITGFLFVVNCDSGRRSRRTFGPDMTDFRRLFAAKPKLEERDRQRCKPAWHTGRASQTNVENLVFNEQGLSDVRARYRTAAYVAISAFILISVPASAAITERV